MATWRYQPVFKNWTGQIGNLDISEDHYFIIAVHFDDEGKLRGWTEEPSTPSGNDVDDLRGCIERMLNDVKRWKAVNIDDIKTGMTDDDFRL